MYDLKSISKSVQDAAREILEAKKPLHPNQQKIDVHEPKKDEITAKDFEMLRAGKKSKMKEEAEQVDELVRLKPGVKEKQEQERQEKEAFKKSRANSPGVSLQKTKPIPVKNSTNEEVDQADDADETLISTPIVVVLKESYMFGDYLTAAKAIVGEEAAIELANYAYNKNDTSIFVEQVTRSDIESKVASHKAAGHDVSEPKYKTKDGKLHAEYVVTDKESGIRRKYIQHGTSRKIENMGTKGKKDEE